MKGLRPEGTSFGEEPSVYQLMANGNRETIGYSKIAVAAIIWGSVGLFVRALDVPILIMVFYRFAFALLATFLILPLTPELRKLRIKKNQILLIVAGLVLTLNWIFFFYALVLTTVANAVLVTYTAPILVALFAPLFLKERLEWKTVISLILSMAGILFIISPTRISLGKPLLGIIFAFGTSLTYATLVIIAKELLENISVLVIIFYESLIATVVLSPFAFVAGLPSGFETWFLLFVLGIAHTVLAPYLYLSGLKVVKAQRAGILTYFDPLSATILATFFLGELPRFSTLVGGFLIIVAGYNVIRKSG